MFLTNIEVLTDDEIMIDDIKEEKQVKSSQLYEDMKKLGRKIIRFMAYFIVCFFLYKMFGVYVFVAFIPASIFGFFMFNSIIKVPGKKFLIVDVENREITKVFIPTKIYNEFDKTGEYSPFSNLEVVKKIDFENQKIEGFWFKDSSDIDFLVDYSAFTNLTEQFKSWIDKWGAFLKNYNVMAYLKSSEFILEINKEFMEMPKDVKIIAGEKDGKK